MTRKSKREIERALDDIGKNGYGGVEKTLTIAELLNYDIEVVDEEAGIVRVVGKDVLRFHEPPDANIQEFFGGET